MLKTADIVVVTKSDLVSQAEREVFSYKIKLVNPHCTVMFINGISGQGADKLALIINESTISESINNTKLRFFIAFGLMFILFGRNACR